MKFVSAAKRRGFTLIELLVVIAIIGVLASTVLASLNTARGSARDSARIAAAKEVQKALELYHISNRAYPTTGGAWRGTCSGFGSYAATGATGYIPNLAPQYLQTLPVERFYTTANQCFLYNSDGVNYKFLIYRNLENCNPGSCPLQDPARPGERTGTVYSTGAMTW